VSGDGWDHLFATFREHNLPGPPIPAPLRSGLTTLEKWHWASDTAGWINREEMYRLRESFIHDLLQDDMADHVRICHAGHGSNSWGITYCLVYRHLVLVIQVGWGGIYMNEASSIANLADAFTRCSALIRQVETMDRRLAETRHRQKLLCLSSGFGPQRCGWVIIGGGSDDSYPVPHVESGAALTVAQHLLQNEEQNR
jgi:hypothetical protein